MPLSKNRTLTITVLTICAFAVVIAAMWLRPFSQRETVPQEVRGEPINAALVATNASTHSDLQPGPRKRRAKPGSFPQRMVQLQAQLDRLVEESPVGTNRLQMFQPAAGAVPVPLPAGAPEVSGYRGVSFAQLAGFDFTLSRDILIATNNADEAAARVLAQVPPETRALDGQKISIRGFLLPLRMDEGLAVEFLLMRDQSLCCFGTIPRLHEWISVRTTGRGIKPQMDQPIAVAGTLHVRDHRENGWLIGLYSLDADKVFLETP